MGRQAKRKKSKRNGKQVKGSFSHTKTHKGDFIQQMERQGYNLKQIQHSPDIPEDKIDPQL